MTRSLLRYCTSIIRSSALVQASSSLSMGSTRTWPRGGYPSQKCIFAIFARVFVTVYVFMLSSPSLSALLRSSACLCLCSVCVCECMSGTYVCGYLTYVCVYLTKEISEVQQQVVQLICCCSPLQPNTCTLGATSTKS